MVVFKLIASLKYTIGGFEFAESSFVKYLAFTKKFLAKIVRKNATNKAENVWIFALMVILHMQEADDFLTF